MPDWPHPAEVLIRTAGNDWVYYTVGDKGGDRGIKSALSALSQQSGLGDHLCLQPGYHGRDGSLVPKDAFICLL